MKTKSKVLWLTACATFFIAAFITGCKKDKFVEAVGKCPQIISTDPANLSVNVPLDKIITATFNEKMNPATLTEASFTLQGASNISGTVTYDDATATMSFTPAAKLTANTTYTATVTTAVHDKMGNAMQADFVWTFSTGTTIVPIVTSTDPADQDTAVFLNKIVTATFNMAMDPLTITTTTFTLKQGTSVIAGTVSYNSNTAYFTPSVALSSNTVYNASITTGAKNVAGTALAANYNWSFTTGSVTAPSVISTDPANNATGVVLNKVVTATFSMPMDPLTITNASFTMKQGPNVITGVVSYSGTTASFTPAVNFLPGLLYTATITTGAKNPAGIPLANNYVWTFTTLGTAVAPTVLSTDPASNATNVVLNKIITATFSEPMDPLTITNATFTLKQGTNPIAGTVSYSGTVASFKPNINLLPGTIYTATITNGAKNLAGTSLVNNYVWTFTTGTATAPVVLSTDPANNATGVLLNKVITATFSEPMDPSTINSSTFTLKLGVVPITGTVSYSGTTASFTPAVNLTAGNTYTATITNGAKNLAGVSLVNNYVWNFSTAAGNPPTVISTDPANNATGVALNKVISATFSEPMDPSTINSTTFLLKQGTATVPGSITYSGSTASFTPTSNLASGTTYTATITTGAKNLSGVSLASNYVWNFDTKAALGGPFVDLKSVGRFGIIAGTGVSNNAGFSEIHDMDVGISPGVRSSITGFPPAIVVNGAIYASDDIAPPGVPAMLTQAKQDLTDAYLFAEGASFPAPASVSGDQGGLTLAPGIYKSTSTLSIASGDLTLDAQGDPNAVWIFQIAAGFTTVGGAGGNVILIGGAQAKNVFWQTGSSATIGGGTSFKGNILALTSITMGAYSTAVGRMLARNGAVVLTSTNIINKP